MHRRQLLPCQEGGSIRHDGLVSFLAGWTRLCEPGGPSLVLLPRWRGGGSAHVFSGQRIQAAPCERAAVLALTRFSSVAPIRPTVCTRATLCAAAPWRSPSETGNSDVRDTTPSGHGGDLATTEGPATQNPRHQKVGPRTTLGHGNGLKPLSSQTSSRITTQNKKQQGNKKNQRPIQQSRGLI